MVLFRHVSPILPILQWWSPEKLKLYNTHQTFKQLHCFIATQHAYMCNIWWWYKGLGMFLGCGTIGAGKAIVLLFILTSKTCFSWQIPSSLNFTLTYNKNLLLNYWVVSIFPYHFFPKTYVSLILTLWCCKWSLLIGWL